MQRIKTYAFFFLMFAFAVYGQSRRLPLENAFLRNGMDANSQQITNLLSISFVDNGSNIIIDASSFLALFEGESRLLFNGNDRQQFMVISNGRPWMTTSDGVREVTLNGDTSFIRQYEPVANMSNVVVYSSLTIINEGGVDDSDYGVNHSDLTNGNIQAIDVVRHFRSGREVFPVQDSFLFSTQSVETVFFNAGVVQSLLSSVYVEFFAVSATGFSSGTLSFYTTTSPVPRIVGVPILSVSASEGDAPDISLSFEGTPVISMESNCLWRIRGRSTDMGL